MYINGKILSWNLKNNIFPKVTKIGSIFAHRIDYNGDGVLRDQPHMHPTPPPPLSQANIQHIKIIILTCLLGFRVKVAKFP